MNGALTCGARGATRTRGELLRATFADGWAVALCRPSLRGFCLQAAGTIAQSRIALLDPDAARRLDAERAAEPETISRVDVA